MYRYGQSKNPIRSNIATAKAKDDSRVGTTVGRERKSRITDPDDPRLRGSVRYFIQTLILWMNMDNWYNLSDLNHPTKRSDKAFPSEAAWP